MSLALETVRQRIATAVDALSGWRESTWPADLFGRDSSNVGHLTFAVGFGDSDPASSLVESSRGRRSSGGEWATEVVVRFAYRLRADAMIADYDGGLAAHDDLRVALLGVAGTGGLHLLVERESRSVLPDGPWYVGETRCRATFLLQLQ